MEVLIEKTGKKIKIRFKGKVCALLSKLKINPETVLVVKNSELITEEAELLDKDKITIISVISGG
jgi:sulfur carrier protein ThiS